MIFTEPPKILGVTTSIIGKPVWFEDVDTQNYPELQINDYEEGKVLSKPTESIPQGPLTKKENLKLLLNELSEERRSWQSAYETNDDFDLVENRKEYYRKTNDDIYTPIRLLNTCSFDWKIKAKVTKKFEKRQWKNATACGFILNVHLVDKEGTKIWATFFNQAAEKFDSEIKENKVYLMSNGRVLLANRKYSLIDNDFTVNFDKNAEIIEVEDDSSIQDSTFNFKNIMEIQNLPENSIIDFIGVVHYVGPINEIQLKNGLSKQRRMLQIIDDTGMMVSLWFWGEHARNNQYEGNPVLGLKGAKLTNYSGKSLNAPENAKILINPDIPRADELREWHSKLKSHENLKILSLDGKSSEGRQNNERLIVELSGYLEEEFLKKGTDKNLYFVVSGYVHHIKNDERNVYSSWPEETWKRKVKYDETTKKWRWDWCQVDYTTWKPTYVLQVKFMDLSESFYISFYRDMANELMGVDADTVIKLRNDQMFHKVAELFSQGTFKKLKLLVKARKQVFNNEPKVIFFATRVYPYSFYQENAMLLSRLEMYSTKNNKSIN